MSIGVIGADFDTDYADDGDGDEDGDDADGADDVDDADADADADDKQQGLLISDKGD